MLGEMIIFEPWRENYHFFQTELDIFNIQKHYVRIHLSTSDLLCFIISNTDTHEFSSTCVYMEMDSLF